MCAYILLHQLNVTVSADLYPTRKEGKQLNINSTDIVVKFFGKGQQIAKYAATSKYLRQFALQPLPRKCLVALREAHEDAAGCLSSDSNLQ